MDYRTFSPSPLLSPFVKCYWTLEGRPEETERRQRVLPDGCIEMAFLLGDDIKRYRTETETILQPRAMVIGPFAEPFTIEPCGEVNTFAARFYPHGFRSFVSVPLAQLANRETPLENLFDSDELDGLPESILRADDTAHRVLLVERFLIALLASGPTIDRITRTTVELILRTRGKRSVGALLDGEGVQTRQMERNFQRHIGISPKKLGRVVRLQSALSLLLDSQPGELSRVAYEAGYFDQAHFIHDFKQLTGCTPSQFGSSQELLISSLLSQESR